MENNTHDTEAAPDSDFSGRGSALLRWTLRSLIAVAMVVAAVAAAVGVYVWRVDGEIRRVGVDNLTADGPDGTENILIAGSTARCGLKTSSPVFGSCAAGVTGVNSDVIMIVHLDARHHSASLLSIPRDLFVPNARSDGPGKIDAALAEGPSQLVNVIEHDLAIPINHYVEVNFDGFQGVVDALGGVQMYFPEPVFDANSGLDIRQPGCVQLDGFQALAVVRARHLQYRPPTVTSPDPSRWPHDPQSDLSRIRRDHEFLRVLARAVAGRGLANPVTDEQLISSLLPQVTVDGTMSMHHMVDLVMALHDLQVNDVPQYTLPVSVMDTMSFIFRGNDYGAVELPDAATDDQVIRQFLGVGAATDTMTGDGLPDPKDIAVTVHNGTGRAKIGPAATSGLRILGFDATTGADLTSTGTTSETVVTYRAPESQPAAERVARAFTGAVVVEPGGLADPTPVSVTLGSAAQLDVPNPPSSRTDHSARPNPNATSNSTLAPPTPSLADLAEFDPRACAPTGAIAG